jgi:hypothetical protein
VLIRAFFSSSLDTWRQILMRTSQTDTHLDALRFLAFVSVVMGGVLLYYLVTADRATVSSYRPALSILLSGEINTWLTWEAADLVELECTATGFFAAVGADLASLGMSLSFTGASSNGGSSPYVLTPVSLPLTVSLSAPSVQAQLEPYAVFRSYDGTVTYADGVYHFVALLSDEAGRRLNANGTLHCHEHGE